MSAESLPRPEELIRHRRMALVLDEITELVPGERATGLWTPDERYFEGHFDAVDGEEEQYFLPGHWQMESVALIACCALLAKRPKILPMFRENDGKWKDIVRPGSTLEVSAQFRNLEEVTRGGATMLVAEGKGSAKVDGKTAYQATLLKAVASL